MSVPIITVDGPSGSGKGTLCARLADTLGFHVLDSGALYRILGLCAYEQGLVGNDIEFASDRLEQALATLAGSLDICFEFDSAGKQQVLVNTKNVTTQIRTETVGGYASVVAQFPAVRQALLQLQKDFAKAPGLIADGRDMGTAVFPNAALKIFLTASAEKRAKRRVKQLQDMGKSASMATILVDIQARDARDANRAASPLLAADDAIALDSSALTANEVYACVLAHCEQKGLVAAS